MKAEIFGQFLGAFADLLDDAGAVAQARAWRALLPIFKVGPSPSVKDVSKALSKIDRPTRTDAPTVEDLARLFPAVERCLSRGATKPLLDDFKLVADALSPFAKWSVVDLVDATVRRLSAQSGGRSRQMTDPIADAVPGYLRRLEGAVGDSTKFSEVFDDLKRDKTVKAPDAKRLAREFTKQSARSKIEALNRIWERHASLIGAGEKAKSTGGRTAA